MVSVSTEEFPYTARYVRELLNLDEATLKGLVAQLALAPRQDPHTAVWCFSQRDLDLLRRAVELLHRGENPQAVGQALRPPQAENAYAPPAAYGPSGQANAYPAHEAPMPTQPPNGYPSANPVQNGGSGTAVARATVTAPVRPQQQGPGRDTLVTLVDAISQSKETILKEISKLLDDRLAGLDEVVVELIRCKAENDSLRQKLAATLKDKEGLEQELARFKPVQFGFYKKVGGR